MSKKVKKNQPKTVEFYEVKTVTTKMNDFTRNSRKIRGFKQLSP